MIILSRRQLFTGSALTLTQPLEIPMPPATAVPLGKSNSVVLNGAGNGTVQLGPAQGGPPTWNVDTLYWQTDTPGVAPIPIIRVFLDDPSSLANIQTLDYDGSLGVADGGLTMVRGQFLYAVFTGGHPAGTASFAVTGTQGT